MKTRILLLFAIVFSLVACQNENGCEDGSTTQITLPNGDFLTIPLCWEYTPGQGFDSAPGRMTYAENDILIRYDIGGLAGSYVDEDTPIK